MTTGVRYRGIGRGPKTRDGCSVELYLRLPYGGEVELIERYIPKAASVMELGCGVGRVTRQLLAHGYRVTAVDNSPEMLAYVPPQASRICADIEGLSIDEKFDAVILASCLVNTPDAALRLAQLARCRERLKPGGRLFLERFDPAWLANVQVGPLHSIGSVEMHVDEAHGAGTERELCFRYREGEDEWLQYFTAAILDDEDVRQCLSSAGFDAPEWINRRWASARVPSDVDIRRARVDEAPGLSALAFEAKAHWGYSIEVLESWRQLLSVTAADIASKRVFVGEIDRAVVGFYSLAPAAGPWELDNLWVSPGAMHRGVGRRLLAHALEDARRGGASRVTVDADPNAASFYLRNGATRSGEVPAPIPGQPERVRPQLAFDWIAPGPSPYERGMKAGLGK